MHVMLLLSCGYLPQYKIPEVEKHKIMTRSNIKDKKDREK